MGMLVMLMFLLCLAVAAQEPTSSSPAAMQSVPEGSHESMQGMNMGQAALSSMPSFHASSGTGWQPASVPETIWMISRGNWDLMLHGAVFVTYNQQGGPRGAGKAESVNYLMAMEQRRLGSGTILFRQMFSAESLTSPHPGFPELFQAGETYHSQALVDRQHPDNVLPNWLCCTQCQSARKFPGCFMEAHRLSPRWGR
jgi:hypothetical protein